VFLCVSPVTAVDLTAARTDGLTDGALMKRVREAADWHDGMVGKARFKAMLNEIKANPGVRLGWQMRHAARVKKTRG
jgi:hypothetical protein